MNPSIESIPIMWTYSFIKFYSHQFNCPKCSFLVSSFAIDIAASYTKIHVNANFQWANNWEKNSQKKDSK